MAVNRTKVLEAAQKFLSKGQYDKAVLEYQKLVHEDPRDVRTLLKIGDLHTRRNKPKDAIDVYQKVADLYAKQGFFLKAVAVYKQILKLDPAHLDSTLKLAKMYEELALTSDALTTYEVVADAYIAQGQMPKALETMQRMIELDGQNVAVRIKHAEALSKAGKSKDAAVAFAAGAQLLKEQGRMDDYVRVVERQLYHDPENVRIARELSGLYLERNDPKRALAKLQICFKADPRDVQTLEMLAEAFRQLGQNAKTISVLKEIARLHGEAGSEEPRRRTLKRVLDLDPNDAEAKQAVSAAPKSIAAARPTAAPPPRRQALQPPPPPPMAVKAPSAPMPPAPSSEEIELDEADELDLLEENESDDVLIVDEPGDTVRGELTPAELTPRPRSEQPAPPTLESRVQALLADADAREGAGDYEGAVSALQGVLELSPDHVSAHERLKDIYLAADRRVDAVKELLWLSSSWEERSLDRAIQYAEAAHELAPRSEATRRRLGALGVPLPGARSKRSSEPSRTVRGRDAFDAELDAILPPLAPPQEEGGFDAAQATLDLLELPISPEDFDAPPPAPRRGVLSPEQASELLEQELSPAEFERAPVPRADLLDREFRPEDFDSALHPALRRGDVLPPPARAPLASSELVANDASERDVGALAREAASPADAARASEPAALETTGAERAGGATEAELLLLTKRRSTRPAADGARFDHPPTAPHAYPDDRMPEPAVRESYADLLLHESELVARAPEPPPAAPPAPPSEAPAPPSQQPPESGARQVASAPAPEPIPAEVEEALDEADFFAAQGLLDEALEVVQEAILIYPASAALKQRLADYEARVGQAQQQPARSPEHTEDESFDIAEQLASELAEVDAPAENDDMIDVESVFAQFKKGVAEQVAPDDSETHFDLGIAYKEMGLLEDAVNEFELAAKGKKRACTALTMIGMCHLERGNPQLAITYFERALTTEQRGPAEELALNYELGAVYEQTGQLDRALAAFEQVAARDRTFRGVATKLDQLRKRGVKPARVSR